MSNPNFSALFWSTLLVGLTLFGGSGCSQEKPPPAQVSQPVVAPTHSAKDPKSSKDLSEQRRVAARNSGTSGPALTASSHRSRAAQERGRKEFEHPASGMKRPKNLHPKKVSAQTIVDPEDGSRGEYPKDSEEHLKLKEAGMKSLTVAIYEQPLSEVMKHYSSQADGKGRATSKGKKGSITYQVEEGTLILSMGEKGGKTTVTRLLIDGSSMERIPGWLNDAAREQRTR